MKKIKQLKTLHQLSQERLAKKIVSRQAITKWENRYAMPDNQNLKALADLFEVSIDYLLDDQQSTYGNNPF
jgi:transcriptional regulator with XRE-family HTH domain